MSVHSVPLEILATNNSSLCHRWTFMISITIYYEMHIGRDCGRVFYCFIATFVVAYGISHYVRFTDVQYVV